MTVWKDSQKVLIHGRKSYQTACSLGLCFLLMFTHRCKIESRPSLESFRWCPHPYGIGGCSARLPKLATKSMPFPPSKECAAFAQIYLFRLKRAVCCYIFMVLKLFGQPGRRNFPRLLPKEILLKLCCSVPLLEAVSSSLRQPGTLFFPLLNIKRFDKPLFTSLVALSL